jgi:hypothetical protein
MIDYYLIYDIRKAGDFNLPNFVCCIKVDDGFKRIDDLEKYLAGQGGISDEIINPGRRGYFQIGKNWREQLEDTLDRFDVEN